MFRPRPQGQQRGPWEFREREEPASVAGRVLMPQILGGVIRMARVSAGVSLRAMAHRLRVTPPVISSLETGAMSATAFHLEMVAFALNLFEQERFGAAAVTWESWELLQVSTQIADRLEAAGYWVYWGTPPAGEDTTRFVGYEALLPLLREYCPPEFRVRLRD